MGLAGAALVGVEVGALVGAGLADALELDSEFVAPATGVSGAGVTAPASVPATAPTAGAFALSPPRKSVTYQPEPLSWNPAAVTCF